ncbi:MAG: hypothetical protein U5K30_06950 [Acidimicrobiales bacterium]|nr:hypothetical protein [Acidimicrobiales bacterium]
MPAETHTHTEPITVDDILDLLSTIVGDEDFDSTLTLEDLGLSDALALMAFWDAIVEEYSERGVGEPDLDDLASAADALELARRTLGSLGIETGTETETETETDASMAS